MVEKTLEAAYELGSPDDVWDVAYAPTLSGGTVPRTCPVCGRSTGIEKLEPYEIALYCYGGQISHFVWSDYPGIIVSRDLLEVFRKESVTGFERTDVIVRHFYDDGEQLPPEQFEAGLLHYLSVTGSCGQLRPQTDGFVVDETCSHCNRSSYKEFPAVSSFILARDQWDGSDLFKVKESPLRRFISERVAQILAREKVRNCKLVPVRII
jgi:hypothetical protein